MKKNLRKILLPVWEYLYQGTLWPLSIVNSILSRVSARKVHQNSVIHISYMVHIPYYMVKALRTFGMKADYMAIGTSTVWDKCDYRIIYSRLPFIRAFQEFLLFWKIVARYEIVHLHFMTTLSYSGWELPLLKKMGRSIVINYRGCEIRDRKQMMKLYPEINICQDCDYHAVACEDESVLRRRTLSRKYGDLFLVTTPDMKVFSPEAVYLPFLAPVIDRQKYSADGKNPPIKNGMKIVHVTNHPGIEGTEYIKQAVENLKAKGYKVNFVFLRGVTPERVLEEYRDADLSIGKMKMGYYANAQIESMFLGVPAVTYIRPEFMTAGLQNSGFIFTDLNGLETTLEYYLKHPEELDKKKKIAHDSILRLHDNEQLGQQLIGLYTKAKAADDHDSFAK